ncbi:MAG: crotonase/enoyl-CoA hydratase family protein [Pseudomonadota bacterium]
MTDHILTEIQSTDAGGSVLALRMNRADKKNAITSAMYDALSDGLDRAAGDDDLRCAVILGSGGVFCAGNDIADFIKAASSPEGMKSTLRFLDTLARFPKPLVAGVDGVAVGVGTTMLMHCDLVLATGRSMFQTPFVDLGLVPEAGSSWLAPRIMGHQNAFAMLGLGEKFTAEEANRAGLVNAVILDADVEAMERAMALAAKPPEALRISRELVRGDRTELYARMDEEAKLFGERLQSGEAQAAFMAFMSKGR